MYAPMYTSKTTLALSNGLTPICLFVSYLWEGRDRIQATVLDCAFSFIAAALLMSAGGQYYRVFRGKCCVFFSQGFSVFCHLSLASTELLLAVHKVTSE